MKLIPAIDLQGGQSKYPFHQIYDPIEIVKELMKQGLHTFLITDLDGVFNSDFVHYEIINQLHQLGAHLIVSGGIRSLKVAEKLINVGAQELLVGTVAIKDQELLMALLSKYNDKIFVAIDTFEDSVFIEGWIEDSDVSPEEFVMSIQLLGVNTFVHSHINQLDDLTVCKDQWIINLEQKANVHIIPVVDLSGATSLEVLKKSCCSDVIIGGDLNAINWSEYKKYHL